MSHLDKADIPLDQSLRFQENKLETTPKAAEEIMDFSTERGETRYVNLELREGSAVKDSPKHRLY